MQLCCLCCFLLSRRAFNASQPMLFLCVAVCKLGLSVTSQWTAEVASKVRNLFCLKSAALVCLFWSRFAQGPGGSSARRSEHGFGKTTQAFDVCSILGCGRPNLNRGVFMSNLLERSKRESRCSSMVQIINLFFLFCFYFFVYIYRCDFYLDFKARPIGRDALLHDGKIDKSSI